MFFDMQKYTYSESLVNTLYTEIIKKIPLDKIKVTKNALFFLSRALTNHSFTFNLQFLYKLKHKVYLSKIAYGVFHL